MNNRPDASVPLRAVEHHLIADGAGAIFFDVQRLRSFSISPLEQDVLARAERPCDVGTLALVERETAPEDVHAAIRRLLDDGLLVACDETIASVPSAEPSRYLTVMVNVAQRCNLVCDYCYVNKGQFDYPTLPKSRMSVADSAKLVEYVHALLPDMAVYAYHFYGGEPLLAFDAIETIVHHALAKADETGTRAHFHITTNGTLLTEAIADFMDRHRFTVYYSYDTNREVHDELRRYKDGRGSFEDVQRNLQLLRGRDGVHLILSSVIRGGNCLTGAIRDLGSNGARQCKAERVRLEADDPHALSGSAAATYLADIAGLVNHYVDYLERAEKPLDYRLTSKILQLLTRKRRDFFCPAGERMLGIASDGEVYPCALHVGRPGSLLGHVEAGIDGQAVSAFRRRFSPEEQADCRRCWNRNLCGGGCSAMVDRFGHENCDVLCAESEAAIRVFHHFAHSDPFRLLSLVSPKVVRWAEGTLNDPAELAPTEPAAVIARD